MTRHTARVERFYGYGVERYGTFHDNYLNFGLWEDGASHYVEAAERLVSRVGMLAGLDAQAVLLDVACGMGTQDRHFARRFGCRRIEAVDVTRKHIALAAARNMDRRIRYHVADACRLPFADATFTHVVAIEGIVHFDTRAAFFREAHRLLRPGGRLAVADFFVGRHPRNVLERRLLDAVTAAWHVPRANVATVAEYGAALAAAGFADVTLEVVSDRVIPGYVREQTRPEVRRRLYRIRGPVIGRLGVVIDRLVSAVYRRGLIGYLLAGAGKPGAGREDVR